MNAKITRRQFLFLAAAGVGSLAFRPLKHLSTPFQFPQAEALGRVNVGMAEIKARPDEDSATVGKIYQDAVVPWLREVVGRRPYRINQTWVETPQGYIWTPYLQPVKNQPNTPAATLPKSSLGAGMWAEVSVPYLDLTLDNPPARSPWLKESPTPRLYYSQVFWIDQVKQDSDGKSWYRINERYGYGDLMWAPAEGFRPLTQAEVAPIHPEAEQKKVVVNVTYQTLSCYEGKDEVYFARVSTGMMNDIRTDPSGDYATPLGALPIWRKLISVHMSGGTTGGGYDLPGVSWTSLFQGDGVAIHSTFWHNNYGEPMSHGCVNASPEDAKWVFRWTNPVAPFDPGDITVGMPGGTIVDVVAVNP